MATPLKYMYDAEMVGRLAEALRAAEPRFKPSPFLRDVFRPPWDQRELKARMRHISTRVAMHLPGAYHRQLAVLEAVAPGFRGFTAMLFPDFVEVFGLDDYAASVRALEQFTRFSSSEFAVRPFILRYERQMMSQMRRWARHDDAHVRRLASEGCRPRLPWAIALPRFKADPTPVLPILEVLKADASDYVRRSVANNLNDIAKDHPGITLATARRWYGRHPATNALVKHACRTLLKRGDPKALALFGYARNVEADIEALTPVRARVRIGEVLPFSFVVAQPTPTTVKLRVEYIVYFQRPRGGVSKKVFQVGGHELAPGRHVFTKRHAFRDLSTRRHHPGAHRIAIAVNGVEKASISISLVSRRTPPRL